MNADGLVGVRKIRQPITSDHDISNAFDGVTCCKGAWVIGMFESFIGRDRFRADVQKYLRDHAFGNAGASEFLDVLSAGSGAEMARAFSTFLDQTGVPLVTAELE